MSERLITSCDVCGVHLYVHDVNYRIKSLKHTIGEKYDYHKGYGREYDICAPCSKKVTIADMLHHDDEALKKVPT